MARFTFPEWYVCKNWDVSGHYRDRAIVLRTKPLGEADRIITLFTRSNGTSDFVAKGIRRPKSRFGSSLEPFTVIDAFLYIGRGMDGVSQAEILASYGSRLVKSTESYIAANVIAETGRRLGIAGGSVQQFDLLHGAFSALSRGISSPEAICSSYLLRSMSAAGWRPALENCAKCLLPLVEYTIDISAGGLVCTSCSEHPVVNNKLCEYLLALREGDWPYINESDESLRGQARNFVFEYTQWHIDHPLKSLKIVAKSW